MNPGFRSNFPLFDSGSHSYEDQSRYRPGQLFWNRDRNDDSQQFAHNFVPTAAGTAPGLASFQYVQPGVSQPSLVQPCYSSSASVPSPSPLPPESIKEEPAGSKTGRGYGKWNEQEEKLLVQLWCDKHTRLQSRHAKQVWEEITKEISKIRNVTSAQCQRKMIYLKDRYKEAKDQNRSQTGGDRKTSPFYDEIDSVLWCRDIVTFSHVEESGPITSPRTSDSSKSNVEKDEDEANLDEQFEQSLAVFGLNKKRERKSERRDERKRAKTSKAPQKERDDEESALFRESMETLKSQGDKLTGVLEAMEKNQALQLQLMNQFMNTFMQVMQSKDDQ